MRQHYQDPADLDGIIIAVVVAATVAIVLFNHWGWV